MIDLKLGDTVVIGSDTYVVGTITGVPPFFWALVLVPAGKLPLDLGKTWTRQDVGVETLTLSRQQLPPFTQNLEPPPTPLEFPPPDLDAPPPPFIPPTTAVPTVRLEEIGEAVKRDAEKHS